MAGSKLTIEDVARAAGVSRSTVSRVMNGVPGATEAVRQHVKDVIAELGYVPDQTARALASRQQPAIDVVVAAPVPAVGWIGSHPYYSRVLAGIMTVLAGRDVQLRIHSVAAAEDADTVDVIARRASVGVVLADGSPALASRLHRQCRRVVSLVATAPSVPAVEADNVGGAYAAVQYLYQLGRRRIAAIHGADDTCGTSRRAGYMRAVAELGLPDLGTGGAFRREVGLSAARDLLARHPDVDAMFVACDLTAAGAVQAITATGRRVPQDVSVVGFDDSIAAVCANPPLSTMRMPVEDMAAAAVRLLLDGPVPTGYRQRFPVELIVRESTAPG
ncbi:LacI family DNA-binding transcriptional regulator [Dactylosporangium siamense]|uniref:LacI family transcriptional regulator n=1 Tax=Dactylosporangium siamense TaxID=685454 RepID=A0A919UI25_9ACTN|nr:LacI family DNA-binding transcriptional regulator [Dactylosporangium siamense]GIG52135.1 LacI family transcriptional regulator [Dactylosporangium siamense]